MRLQTRAQIDERLPKYFSISQDIIRMIKRGKLMPGMRIPSENEIIDKYEVSNTTARKALHELNAGRWVVKIKGKGTFVHGQGVVRSVDRILSFTKNMIEAGYTPSTKVLHHGVVQKGYSAMINGRRYSMKGPVYKIHRLRFADDLPMMLEVRYISLALCPGIDKIDLTASLYDAYRDKYGLELTEIHQMLSTEMIESEAAPFFDIHSTIPGFLVDGVTFCGREIILEMEKSIYRGDRYTFAVRAMYLAQEKPS
ncbi:MAG: GntR family transcriptional regulator [Spirochaetia bacterium]|jgi:GntR family transcriptional regulator